MAKQVILVGVLKAWMANKVGLEDMEHQRITLAMAEVASSGGATKNKTGGKLKLGGLVFQEYKVNTASADPLRFFGFLYNEDLHVTAIANYHKSNKYRGLTWDNASEWPSIYAQKNTDLDAFIEAVFDDELLHRQGKGIPKFS